MSTLKKKKKVQNSDLSTNNPDRSVTCGSSVDLEEVAGLMAVLTQERRWSDIEKFPKSDKLLFEMRIATPDTYSNKKRAFGVLSISGWTYR